MRVNRVHDIREEFIALKALGETVTDKTGCKMLEIISPSFLADEETIFGPVNYEYVAREIDWYKSQSLNVNDIRDPVPAIWKKCATEYGLVNSNYGWCIWSKENGHQFWNVVRELRNFPDSRRATMIYQRPSMWKDFNHDGMSDFICTYAHQYFIRDGKLVAVVYMRSNDVVFGYRNDRAWASYVHGELAAELGLPVGDMFWNVGSLHVYERHFDLVK